MLRRRCPNDKIPEWTAACWPHPLKTWEPLWPQRCCRQEEMSGKQRRPSRSHCSQQLWCMPILPHGVWTSADMGAGSWHTADSLPSSKGPPWHLSPALNIILPPPLRDKALTFTTPWPWMRKKKNTPLIKTSKDAKGNSLQMFSCYAYPMGRPDTSEQCKSHRCYD